MRKDFSRGASHEEGLGRQVKGETCQERVGWEVGEGRKLQRLKLRLMWGGCSNACL
jgi:hypothetical protein